MHRLVLVIVASIFASPLLARETKAQKQEASQQFRRFFVGAEGMADCAKGTVELRRQQVKKLSSELEPLAQRLTGPRREKVLKSFATFGDAVVKGQPAGCVDTLLAVKTEWKEFFRLVASPSQTPQLDVGRQAYAMHCASCHGPTGKGDGPLASKGRPMIPPPTDFTGESARLISPYRSFNALITGKDGTTMGSYEELLSTHEMWSLAFYLATLPRTPGGSKNTPAKGGDFDLEALSYRSDAELERLLPASVPSSARQGIIDQLRTKDGFDPSLSRQGARKR